LTSEHWFTIVRQQYATRFAKIIRLNLNLIDAIRVVHHTLKIFAMNEPKGVTKLMNGFLLASLVKHPFIAGQSVKLLAKPVNRHQRTAITKLGLSEHKSQHWYKKIHIRHSEQLPVP